MVFLLKNMHIDQQQQKWYTKKGKILCRTWTYAIEIVPECKRERIIVFPPPFLISSVILLAWCCLQVFAHEQQQQQHLFDKLRAWDLNEVTCYSNVCVFFSSAFFWVYHCVSLVQSVAILQLSIDAQHEIVISHHWSLCCIAHFTLFLFNIIVRMNSYDVCVWYYDAGITFTKPY